MRGPAGVPGSASSGSTWPIRFGVSTGRTAKPVTKLVKEFGMTVRRPSTDLEYHLKLPAETSWIVEQVVPNSRAEKLGLKRFDVIAGADDEDLTEFSTLSRAKKRLSIVRRAKPSRIDITERTK
jgi:S1-C subfamily serine protease